MASKTVKCLLAIAFGLSVSSQTFACNIPVFRYALERWKSDTYEVIVFHDGDLTDDQNAILKKISAASNDGGGIANLNVTRVDVSSSGKKSYMSLWTKLQKTNGAELPYVVVQTSIRDQKVNCWTGSLDQSAMSIIQSPARKKLTQRMLAGDAVVWLIVKGSDAEKNKATRKVIDQATKNLGTRVSLPEGIGLPGSELYSDVPLLLQFGVLEIDAGDPSESFLIKLLSGIQADAFAEGEPLVVPVFGRGRALEVIPGSDLSANVIEDLTVFLSGPCSCQVKDRNPGFDLLFSVDWDTELFGEDGERPKARPVSEQKSGPRLLTIPPGRKP